MARQAQDRLAGERLAVPALADLKVASVPPRAAIAGSASTLSVRPGARRSLEVSCSPQTYGSAMVPGWVARLRCSRSRPSFPAAQ